MPDVLARGHAAAARAQRDPSGPQLRALRLVDDARVLGEGHAAAPLVEDRPPGPGLSARLRERHVARRTWPRERRPRAGRASATRDLLSTRRRGPGRLPSGSVVRTVLRAVGTAPVGLEGRQPALLVEHEVDEVGLQEAALLRVAPAGQDLQAGRVDGRRLRQDPPGPEEHLQLAAAQALLAPLGRGHAGHRRARADPQVHVLDRRRPLDRVGLGVEEQLQALAAELARALPHDRPAVEDHAALVPRRPRRPRFDLRRRPRLVLQAQLDLGLQVEGASLRPVVEPAGAARAAAPPEADGARRSGPLPRPPCSRAAPCRARGRRRCARARSRGTTPPAAAAGRGTRRP